MLGTTWFSLAQILVPGSKNYGSRQRKLFCYTAAKVEVEAAETAGNRTGNHLSVDYFTHTLNFSRDEAISAVAKLSPYKSQANAAIVVDYLKRIGMEQTHINAAVSKFPKLLLYHPDKNLHPKIQCLEEFGVSGRDLVDFVARHPFFLARGLETHLRPTLHLIRQAAGSNQNAAKALKRFGRLLSYSSCKTIENNILLLQREAGLSDDQIQRFIVERPCYLTSKPTWIRNILTRVEMEFGISRSSPVFYGGLLVAAALNKSTVDKKLEIFRSYGWSNSEISTMLQKLPQPLTLSEARLKKVLNFLMKELGYESHYLAFRPVLLKYSLEKKIIPRSQVLKILEENELRACSLFTAIVMSESKFFGEYVLPYKNKLPDMYQKYTTSTAK
ncbi:PREDICTED: transcription termination factor MTERF2, chloroplastic-like isoform X3 [Ipomoea nil]|uniref:transcription termination factor MTERF2, chloroplastic-like isoform X3 n=1 Tax=Ipomoea nil TaxID=35883 RepID=UPI000901C385|nr:PREDICTED: transcription termination factor MTERF2, chloroplastic-like isoform X3 [Ipomoea nil]